ncbi:hypothetical protein FQR65_LT20618 [Abscondita terminalis]|nr:hypothetical protein FQR65_LT20618 [Abscondita terminalis]
MLEIKELDNLLHSFLGEKTSNLKYVLQPLKTTCEHFGSILIEIVLSWDNTEKEKPLSIVEVCFRNEINFYKYIEPCLSEFQKDHLQDEIIDFFPRCYALRTTLKHDDDGIDDDVVLLLENLKSSGYFVIDGMDGFDLQTTLCLLKNLATFHAVSLSLKILRPEKFKAQVLNRLVKGRVFESISKQSEQKLIELAMEAVDDDALKYKTEKALKFCFNSYKENIEPLEPFATLLHNDYWVNNIMVKFRNEFYDSKQND